VCHALSIFALPNSSCQPHTEHTATHCNTLQHTATHCNTLQHTATPQRTATHRIALQRNVTHCNALQRTATHCNALQLTAKHTRGRGGRRRRGGGNLNSLICHIRCDSFSRPLQQTIVPGSSVCCSVLQCVAVCCSVLQCVAAHLISDSTSSQAPPRQRTVSGSNGDHDRSMTQRLGHGPNRKDSMALSS